MKNLLEQYVDRFGVHPPKLMMTHYEDDEYQELLKRALENDSSITGRDVEKAYEGCGLDIVVFKDSPNEVLNRYSYDRGETIFNRINNTDKEDLKELRDIINQIVLWKINRMVCLDADTLRLLSSAKHSVKSIDDLDQSKELLKKLLKSKGIRLPMASTILHFFVPDAFPIIDQRAYRELYDGKEYKEPYSIDDKIDLYICYVRKCMSFYKEHLEGQISFSDIDKYLYQRDKESGKIIKGYN